MVGLVLVSHSSDLAEALLGLIGQISSGQPPRIAIAAGMGEDHLEFGTNATEIAAAVQSVAEGDGVAVLMDLGSAILSADMALELLPEAIRAQVRLVAAPFVEGAIAAAVQASLGSDLEAVCREAEQALQRKIDQLAPASPPLPEAPAPMAPAVKEKGEEVVLTLKNALGLHARPAAKFVQTAATFQAEIQVRNLTAGKGPVSARSLLGVISLGAVRGTQIGLTANGPDARQALDTLATLVEVTLPSMPGE
jgi:phosphocarrier protein FPr